MITYTNSNDLKQMLCFIYKNELEISNFFYCFFFVPKKTTLPISMNDEIISCFDKCIM